MGFQTIQVSLANSSPVRIYFNLKILAKYGFLGSIGTPIPTEGLLGPPQPELGGLLTHDGHTHFVPSTIPNNFTKDSMS